MKTLHVALANCHGIRALDATLDFGSGNAVAIYAPNGTMKTSFARTFEDLAGSKDTVDNVFPDRKTSRSITNEGGQSPNPDDVAVVLSYDEELGPTESTSTLLVNPTLRKEYEALQAELLDARDVLVSALASQSRTKQDIVATVSRVFMQSEDKFFDALIRVAREIEQLEDARFADLPHDLLFNDKVATALKGTDVQAELTEYVTRVNELLDQSTFFNRKSFTYYNATNVTKSLGANGFFAAQHALLLHGEDEPRRITSDADLQALITEEKTRISGDAALRKKLDGVERAVHRNEDTRKFFEFISNREDLLPEFANVLKFHQDVWKSYLKAHQEVFQRVVECYKETEVRRKEIERQAATESTQWDNVIKIFNERFSVPFTLRAENKHRVALGQDAMLNLVFEFNDGDESTGVKRDELLSVLSNGEKKALYILNVLFEMEARKASGRETIFVIDDLADSFDYKNKYAIIQYLKEMADHANFKLILLTHNFDFFRTLLSRQVVGYNRCFMAQKADGKVMLNRAKHVKNPFINGFKKHFFTNGMQRIASIPFVRNILEYTKGEDDPDYLKLTSLLHWKKDSSSIENSELDRIFNQTFQSANKKSWTAGSKSVIQLLLEQAEAALVADEGINFENKIVLSIAARIVAEQHMVAELADPTFTDGIMAHQTQALFQAYESRGLGTADSLRTLDDVVLMTPENIHVNSFMYEPIIDLSDTALRDLYSRVKNL
ncbi:phage infection protein [Brevibacterium aurantiacum]|uniref:Phage infection protein n=1 Tax=Brevibacterium aurantiacum TaxID=273384 RepID=A0A2A3ZCN4_BREAU|nr:phage infection protein [Brevibacterium aurantiacum]PCC49284.1 phage infection protein [Brevibacterium aurantiacum]